MVPKFETFKRRICYLFRSYHQYLFLGFFFNSVVLIPTVYLFATLKMWCHLTYIYFASASAQKWASSRILIAFDVMMNLDSEIFLNSFISRLLGHVKGVTLKQYWQNKSRYFPGLETFSVFCILFFKVFAGLLIRFHTPCLVREVSKFWPSRWFK